MNTPPPPSTSATRVSPHADPRSARAAAFDLVVRNAHVVTAADHMDCDIGITDGRIQCPGPGPGAGSARDRRRRAGS